MSRQLTIAGSQKRGKPDPGCAICEGTGWTISKATGAARACACRFQAHAAQAAKARTAIDELEELADALEKSLVEP